MKILHTADWHLGNVFHGHVRTDEHQHFLQWLLGVIEERKPDALLITGDVFDTANPSASAEELFYDFLLQATSTLPGLQVVITAGTMIRLADSKPPPTCSRRTMSTCAAPYTIRLRENPTLATTSCH